jgi:hypothetical protein
MATGVADEGLFTASAGNALPEKVVSPRPAIMAGDRIAQALARIEAAAGRIEMAAGKAAPDSGDVGETELARKYATLRREAGAALTELDRLIGTLDR